VSLIHSVALVLRPTASVFNLDDTKALHSVASNPHLKKENPARGGVFNLAMSGIGLSREYQEGGQITVGRLVPSGPPGQGDGIVEKVR
jgi:hypothetical protein